MKPLENFAVQPVDATGEPKRGTCVSVEARGPVHAAELALGEILGPHGAPSQMRALVWKLADDYTPVSIPLFARDQVSRAAG